MEKNGLNLNNETVYLLYQQDIRDMESYGIETIDIRQNQAASQAVLDIVILDSSDGLQMMIDYSASLYDDETIEKFKDIFFDEAVLLPALLWSLVSGWSATTEKVPEAHPS